MQTIDLGTFKWEDIKPDLAEKVMDHQLKIAILDFLNRWDNPPIIFIIPHEERDKNKCLFEQLFYYIKNFPANPSKDLA